MGVLQDPLEDKTQVQAHPENRRNYGDAHVQRRRQCGVVTNRKECWQGLEQDITARVLPGSTYTVSACVGVSGPLHGSVDVLATLKLEYGAQGAGFWSFVNTTRTSFLSIGRISVCKERWGKLEGTFSLQPMPDRVVFYLEGPSSGIGLLIKSALITYSNPSKNESVSHGCFTAGDENIILNPIFEDGLNKWSGRGCKIVLYDSLGDEKIVPLSGKHFVAATDRTQSWNGVQREVTGRVQPKLVYDVTAVVRIFGNNVTSSDVRVTLWVQTPDLREKNIGIANAQVTDMDWVRLQGKFLLNGSPSKVVIHIEGPPSGIDILLNSLIVKHAEKIPTPPPVIENPAFGVNIIGNSNLSGDTNGWFPLGNCPLSVATGSPHVLPPMARDTLGPSEPVCGRYILVTNRTQNWMGPSQIITDKLKLFLKYQVSAWVRIGFGATDLQNVNIALTVDN